MKNYFLPALIWVLAASQAFAQKNLSPSVKPYSDNWSYHLKCLFNHAGFDLPAASVNRVSSRSPLQLDSTKTYYAYNLNAPGDSTPLFRTNYQYPSANTKIENEFQFDQGGWQQLSRSTLTSDGQQRLVAAYAEVYDPATGTFTPDSRLVIHPHGDSPELIDSVFTYLWDSTILDWHIILSIRNSFDAQDRIRESISSVEYFGDPVIFKETYFYDANGDNHLIEEVGILGLDTLPGSRTDIMYADHRPIEVKVSVFNGLDFAPSTRQNYAYTLSGALRLQLSFEWDAANDKWRMTQRIEYGFDAAERVGNKLTIHMNPDGSEERDMVTYAYIADDNLSLEMYFLWSDDLFDWVLDSKKHYYYNGLVAAPVVPAPVLALQIAPNPAVDAVRFTLEDEALVQVFSPAGQMIQSGLLQPGQEWNVAGLPAGIYQVTARQGADMYRGKIVKQ